MNYATIKPLDVANGTGIRVSLFVSGCTRHCVGCFNPEAWNFDYGEPFTRKTENYILHLLSKPYVNGLSILGGDPMEPANRKVLIPFLKRVKRMYPRKDIWMWTGAVVEELVGTDAENLLCFVDVLVDGPFVLEKKNPSLKFRGSENQRIIIIKKGRLPYV